MRQAILLGLAGVLLSSAVLANPNPAGEAPQARIPFANHGSIENWQADGGNAIYLEGPRRQWYRGEFLGYCPDIGIATTIGFETNAGGDFDNFSTILVRGHRCALKSLVKSAPPPRKAKKARASS